MVACGGSYVVLDLTHLPYDATLSEQMRYASFLVPKRINNLAQRPLDNSEIIVLIVYVTGPILE